jgi:ATP-dependent helicase/DNAse subunit B
MAEHIRNQLARLGLPVRPSRVITLAQFVDLASGSTGSQTAASKAALDSLIGEALERLQIARFQAVSQYKGFRSALAVLLEEADGDALPADVARVSGEVQESLASQNLALRNQRLRAVVRAVAQSDCAVPPLIVFDGFFSFSQAELEVIQSLAARTRVVITLPVHATRSSLLAAGFSRLELAEVYRTPKQELFRAPTLEQEAEEIARRILEESAKGRPFREMGIVLRAREPYAPALATTLARFGIPSRFYFANPLSGYPVIDFLGGIVRAMLGGWNHAELLRLIRMPVSGVGATPEGDRFDFAFRVLLPGRGLPLRARFSELPRAVETLLDGFALMNGWLRAPVPANEWASRFKMLRSLVPRPTPEDDLSADQMYSWTSTAAALDAFDAVLDETAGLLAGEKPISAAEFWKHAQNALELKELRVSDRRRDVVHVMDVFEARQWELAIVFVCGMVERHFPQYHREDPLMDDAARRRAGLDTSIDLQREERSLFELAITRATDRTILSYSRYDDRGEATLPSFFLGDLIPTECGTRIRPKLTREVTPLDSAPNALRGAISDRDLLDRVAGAHRILSPSSIERYLQCPFQFFGDRTLRLQLRPPAPRDRFTVLVQGSLMHEAIAALEEAPLLGVGVLLQVFAAEARRLRIPVGYRSEAVWLEMQRNLSAFLAEKQPSTGWPARVEEQFNISLSPTLNVRGRIDRLEAGPNGEAVVIDYKYSAANKIRERVKDQDKGDVVQAGLYLVAAVKQFGLTPAGMLYCGLRQVEWGGWHVPIAGLERVGESCTTDRIEELMRAAETKAVEVHAAIVRGDIAVRPADVKKCDWCDYRDICRIVR